MSGTRDIFIQKQTSEKNVRTHTESKSCLKLKHKYVRGSRAAARWAEEAEREAGDQVHARGLRRIH